MNNANKEKRIILIIGSTETLAYFSKQMGAYFSAAGREVFYWDMAHPLASATAFDRLDDRENSLLITFNFLGLCGEGQMSRGLSNVWDINGIEKICIMVDSPIYYYRQLSLPIDNLRLVCIDRNHAEYVKKFHPIYGEPLFLPLCGNLPLDDTWLKPGPVNRENCEDVFVRDYAVRPLKNRSIDLIFIGNYVTVDSIMPSITKAAPEYRDFVMSLADDLIAHPDQILEEKLYSALKETFPDEEESSYPEAMFHLIFIDLYIRTYFRTDMIKTLADNGFRVHCIGQDWDRLDTLHPENLIHSAKMMTSADCVRELSEAKLSLNIMPWFKAGAHDRIFSSMLAGAVSITDSSSYLDGILTPWKDHVPFTLGDRENLIEAVDRVRSDEELAQNIADSGRILAEKSHTWDKFAERLLREFGL